MRPSPVRTALLAAAAALVPAALLVSGPAGAALPKAPGAIVPAALPSEVVVGGLEVENSFVSSVGWVKPGDEYPSRVVVTNPGDAAVSGLSVRLPETRGMEWVGARSTVGTAGLSAGVVTWSVPSVPARSTVALVLQAAADTFAEEPTVVWRNISSSATITVGGVSKVAASHGPKVIPPSGGYETARYGDRPFPVVPVDYLDFKHTADAADLESVINGRDNPASTFNLFQENSYGQLFPKAVIGSVAVGDEPYSPDDPLTFTTIDPARAGTCTGTTSVDPTSGEPTPLYTDRVVEGWYQLPGQRQYYGADANGSALVGAVAGVGALQSIDGGCGPTAKTAYDAAVVADPDIDYNDFDTDKDGVVDFFEVIFQGCGGNGDSQLGPAGSCTEAPNDNVWPHSSSLENDYLDPVTGLGGYVSKDQLRDLEGNLLWFTDTTFTSKTTDDRGDALRVFVRVGPYNVNPESSIDKASVISHEYGHSLGLPDYYSSGARVTYGDFNLMAEDKSQNMDVISKKELGWIVPKVLPTGTTKVEDFSDSKLDTGEIDWVTPDGVPYTLSAAGGDYGIHNGEAYAVALPGRQLVDPALLQTGASGKRVWWSRQGNDAGCPPRGGRNLDFAVPGLDALPAGTPVTATFNSYWDIEWDYDYGFVLTGRPNEDGSIAYTSVASDNGFTTPATQNPNQNGCQSTFGNGITGSSGSYDAGVPAVDRVAGDYRTADNKFVADSYDLSELAGVEGGVVRFSYATDPALSRAGWFIDDLKVTATVDGAEKVLFSSDFEDGSGGPNDARVFPGGCKDDLSVSNGLCTEGWSYLEAGTPSSQEHAYLLEMRDRSGFDFDGRGENDRGAIAFQPGLLLTYTDESHGYGNNGTDNPPAQSPLDSTPVPGEEAPELSDATFLPVEGRSSYTDSKATPHLDNYLQPTTTDDKDAAPGDEKPWTFDYDCLKFDVTRIAGDADNSTDAYDLAGDVTFTTAGGCAAFNYGFASESAVPPAIGGPGLPVDRPRPGVGEPATPGTAAPGAPGGGGLAATGGLGAPALAVLVLVGAGALARRRRTA